ncbi:MAG: TonB family protein [Gemmatimonas sp.]|nr:TonB family protein [Gemmatimonas sp.]
MDGPAILVGLLLFLVAAIVERVIPGLGLPRRAVWATSMAGSVILPLASVLVPSGEPTAGVSGIVGSAVARGGGPGLELSVAPDLWWVDPVLLAGWAMATAAVSFVLIRSRLELRHDSSRWVHGEVCGSPVTISPSTGPAVVGFIAPVVVVPGWVVSELDEWSQRMIYVHEREHIRARDPLLLLLGLAAAALFPWNPGIWLGLRALRQAVELDCDARVVRLEGVRSAYGSLLLDVARHLNQRPPTSIAVTSPPLERRIRFLTNAEPIPGWPIRTFLLTAACAISLIVARLPSPPRPSIEWRVSGSDELMNPPSSYGLPPSPPDSRPRLVNRHETPGILDGSYPPMLRDAGVGGTAVVWIYVDPRGRVERTSILESSGNPELDRAAQGASMEFQYRPAVTDGRPTAEWIQQSISFLPPPSPGSVSGRIRLAIWTTPTLPTLVAMR